MRALFSLSIFVLLTGCYNTKMSTDEIITRRGWVMDIAGNPLDSVEISNFKNEILAYSNKNGYFEIKEEDYIFHQKIYFKKEYYITDTIRYYDFSEIRSKWMPFSGLDTIILKKRIKAN